MADAAPAVEEKSQGALLSFYSQRLLKSGARQSDACEEKGAGQSDA